MQICPKKNCKDVHFFSIDRGYSLFEASYCSIVFDCMITVVSPRLTLLEVVVTVRVTLQEVSITERPIAKAVSNVRRICFTYFFIVLKI